MWNIRLVLMDIALVVSTAIIRGHIFAMARRSQSVLAPRLDRGPTGPYKKVGQTLTIYPFIPFSCVW